MDLCADDLGIGMCLLSSLRCRSALHLSFPLAADNWTVLKCRNKRLTQKDNKHEPSRSSFKHGTAANLRFSGFVIYNTLMRKKHQISFPFDTNLINVFTYVVKWPDGYDNANFLWLGSIALSLSASQSSGHDDECVEHFSVVLIPGLDSFSFFQREIENYHL